MIFQYDRAFPLSVDGTIESEGLTKREYFVAAALQGVLASDTNGMGDISRMAAYAVKVADRLIMELENE